MKNSRFLPHLAASLFTLAAGALPVLTTLVLTPSETLAAGESEVTFDSFYQNLADNGDWYNTPEFGYVFQPYIAYKNDQWRPYTDGYWAETDQGWTWVSYEDFGWACYHYGRWSQLENVGWVWVPGYEWGPGWVSWRTGDEYVGWAPLPPKVTRRVAATTVGGPAIVEEEPRPAGGDRVYEGRLLRPEDVEDDYDTGYNGGVDVQYDIGPAQYSFVPVQRFGAPYLAEAVVPVGQNITIIENTTNVTNIIYRRGPRDERVLYCGGPDYSFLSQRVERPIPRLLLERRTDDGGPRPGPRPDRFSVVRDNRLEVFAPLVSRQPVNFNQVHPVRVKETLVRPQVLHGWRSAQQQDPRLVERLRERFQQQARQAPPARQVAENFVTPAAFRAQPPPSIQEQQRQHQPPDPRTVEGSRFNGNAQPPTPNLPPPPNPNGARPGVVVRPPQPGPIPTVVQPPPPDNAGSRNLTEAERQARRDAQRRAFDQRQGNRPPGPQPGNPPPAPPNVVNQGNTPPPPAVAPPSGEAAARAKRSAEERDAYRASKQAARPNPPATENNNPAPRTAPQPFQAPPANPEPKHDQPRPPRSREEKPPERSRPAQEQPREPRRPEPPAESGRAEAAARTREALQQQQQQQQQAQREAARRQAPPEARRPAEARPQPQPGKAEQGAKEERRKPGEKENQ